MRSDMHEVVIERPRGGGDGPLSVRRARRALNDPTTFDDGPKRGSWSPAYYRSRKYLSDLLGPLRRFLQRRVGHRWDDVYSEIRANLRVDTVTHLHILQHLDDMVVKSTWLDDDGELWGSMYWGRVDRIVGNRWRSVFYVDPHGTLRRAPTPKRVRERHEALTRVFRRADFAAVQVAGIWYALELVPRRSLPGAPWFRYDDRTLPIDAAFGRRVDRVSAHHAISVYGAEVYGRAGKQLGKRALRAWGLQTGAPAPAP